MTNLPDESWEELLAERARAAAGDRPPATSTSAPSSGRSAFENEQMQEARRFLEFAFRRKEPTVAAGSRMEGAKRLVLRGARILTRPQTEFNAAVVEAMERVLRELASLRGEATSHAEAVAVRAAEASEAIRRLENVGGALERRIDEMSRSFEGRIDESSAKLEDAKREIGERLGHTVDGIESALSSEQRAREEVSTHLARVEEALAVEQKARDEASRAVNDLAGKLAAFDVAGERPSDLKREIERLRALAALDRQKMAEIARAGVSAPDAGDRPAAPRSAPAGAPLPDVAYFEFEDRFRGPEDEIRTRQEVYLPFFRALPAVVRKAGPVLDVGCGRGEFLELLARDGIAAAGVDSNAAMAARCREKGLRVRTADLFDDLGSRADGSLAGLFAAQVVEHLSVPALVDLLRLARRKIAPGGGIGLETINPESLFAMKFFWHDPTHVRPLPAPTLEALARAVGFAEAEVRWLSPVPANQRLRPAGDPNLEILDQALFGHQDYALLARVLD